MLTVQESQAALLGLLEPWTMRVTISPATGTPDVTIDVSARFPVGTKWVGLNRIGVIKNDHTPSSASFHNTDFRFELNQNGVAQWQIGTDMQPGFTIKSTLVFSPPLWVNVDGLGADKDMVFNLYYSAVSNDGELVFTGVSTTKDLAVNTWTQGDD